MVVTDGAKRDRCPWLGDQAVIAATMLTYSKDVSPVENTLALFASRQHRDGYIPSSPTNNWAVELFDFRSTGSWRCTTSISTGPTGAYLERSWPDPRSAYSIDSCLSAEPGRRCSSHARQRLRLPPPAGQRRRVPQRARAERASAGVELARLRRPGASARRWTDRADRLARSISRVFWDAGAGAFLDTTAARTIHPQDGNAFAALARLPGSIRALAASGPAQRQAVGQLDRRQRRLRRLGLGARVQRTGVPFMSYFENRARFEHGLDATAHEQLRRTWGFMVDPLKGGPGTMWEAIGQFGSIDGYQGAYASMASGWSSGGGPLLTRYMLGVRPTSPGYASFTIEPHLAGHAWVRGAVPTPQGPDLGRRAAGWARARVSARFPRGLKGAFALPGRVARSRSGAASRSRVLARLSRRRRRTASRRRR